MWNPKLEFIKIFIIHLQLFSARFHILKILCNRLIINNIKYIFSTKTIKSSFIHSSPISFRSSFFTNFITENVISTVVVEIGGTNANVTNKYTSGYTLSFSKVVDSLQSCKLSTSVPYPLYVSLKLSFKHLNSVEENHLDKIEQDVLACLY